MTTEEKRQLVTLLADLLDNGFSLNESVVFIENADLFPEVIVQIFRLNFTQGYPLADSFRDSGFSNQQVTQIRLADVHGNFTRTLRNIAKQMKLMERQRKNFQKAITYPSLLLSFLLGILIAMRQVILPQLLLSGLIDKDSFLTLMMNSLPLILIGCFFLLLLLALTGYSWLRSRSYLERAKVFANIPIVGQFYRPYISGYFSLEWGKLFQEGLEMKQIIQCMKEHSDKGLMHELALEMEKSMRLGQPLVNELSQFGFFTQEFATIIQQGEVKGNLGKELVIYSEWVWQRFFQKLEKGLTWLQPVVFLLVATMIILFYAAMLLPIYGNMEGLM